MRNFLIPFLIFFSLFISEIQASTWKEGDPTDHLIRHEGQIFSVTISRGRPVRIFVLGKEEAKINLKEVSLTLRRLKPYPGKVLKLDRYGGYFEVKNPDEFNQSSVLEVSAHLQGKKESFKVQLKEKP